MMTFNNNEKDFQEKLQKDTEIPVIVHERINQAYRLIENNTAVQKKAPKDPYHWMKIGGRIAGGAAAVLLIAFVFYMTDPVMAKNILKAPAIMRGSICGIQQNDTDVYF